MARNSVHAADPTVIVEVKTTIVGRDASRALGDAQPTSHPPLPGQPQPARPPPTVDAARVLALPAKDRSTVAAAVPTVIVEAKMTTAAKGASKVSENVSLI